MSVETKGYIIREVEYGNVFSVTTGVATSGAAAGINALALFNPVSNTKKLKVYMARALSVTAGQPQLTLVTSDPALGTSLTAQNRLAGSTNTSNASASTSAAVVVLSGTVIDVGSIVANAVYDFVNGENDILILEPGQGIEIGVFVAATSKYGIIVKWIEEV